MRGRVAALALVPPLVIVLGALAILTVPLAVEGQQAGKVSRVGFLRFGSIPPAFIEGFRQGLRELGYVEGQNITLHVRMSQRDRNVP